MLFINKYYFCTIVFIARRDIDIGILSVRLSVTFVPVLYQNRLT